MEEIANTIKISNKNILDNNKIISELENDAIEISKKNSKKNRQINKLVHEIDELGTKKLNISKIMEERLKKLNIENQSN